MAKKQTENHMAVELLPNMGNGHDELSELYKWSYADAVKAQDIYELQNPEPIDTNNPGIIFNEPFSRWQAAQELMELYDSHKKGDKGAILKALHVCFIHRLQIPRWCETAYVNAYRKVNFFQAKTWQDVFGNPHKKGTHIATKKQEKEMSFRVYDRIGQIKKDDPSVPIDGWLFEKVGREFAIGGKTLTEEYYYKWKNFFDNK
jgi:hypothetical protein